MQQNLVLLDGDRPVWINLSAITAIAPNSRTENSWLVYLPDKAGINITDAQYEQLIGYFKNTQANSAIELC